MKLYRKFKLDADGKPTVRIKFGMLGVRPRAPKFPKKRFDVGATLGSDQVNPGGGGLSVFEDPAAIQISDDDLVLCVIETDDLSLELERKEAGKSHYHIEPAHAMTLDEFQERLAETRELWERV